MKKPSFFERLASSQKKNKSLLCIGLDPELGKLPEILRKSKTASPLPTEAWHIATAAEGRAVAKFNSEIIDATKDLACCYKPNWAFYEAMGQEGMRALEKTIETIPSHIPIIADAKRGDIGNTAKAYARAIFEVWGADAVTLNPYMGYDTLEPFLEYTDRGVYALCLTSNPGAADFQVPGRLYLKVAKTLSERDAHGNLGLVVGATQSKSIAAVRKVAPKLPFLLPGIGAQGGSVEAAVKGAWGERPASIVINVSRSVLYASNNKDFAQAARDSAMATRMEINEALQMVQKA